jgi:hypothetical protein
MVGIQPSGLLSTLKLYYFFLQKILFSLKIRFKNRIYTEPLPLRLPKAMLMKIKQFTRFIPIIIISTLLAYTGCRKDEYNTDPGFKLGFSTDTILFDTVFTTIGSVTRQLVIHNSGNSKINISKITLARGMASPFRLNIDGTAGEFYHNLEIGPKDSAYIFVKVTINPNNVNNPLIESDSIVFETNGNIQDVKLVAWGQDAYFHHNTVLSGEVTLPADKPHVIYGKLTAGKNCKMTILPGTRLYFHSGSSFEISSGASLDATGTLELPIIFTGDRLDKDYKNLPGLWDGIWLEGGSKSISFTYAEITNAIVGIQADSCGFAGGEPLRLHNCLINNMKNYGILATNAKVVSTNCQITNCGGNVVSVEQGGSYDFRNCTLANYFSGSNRSYPALAISNYSLDSSYQVIPGELTNAYFGNCIITGSQQSEIGFYEQQGTLFNFQFDQCLVSWTKETKYESNFIHCTFNKEAKFKDPYTNDFQLDTLSSAIDAASVSIINATVPDIKFDRLGISRLIPGPPDLGAYERVEKK